MTEIRKTVIENLKTLCKLRNIKNVQIAEHLDVSQGSVSNWFKGTNSIDIDNLYKLCRFLGVSLDQIFNIKPLNPDVILSDDELKLIASYRAADNRARVDAQKILDDNPREKDTEQSAI